MQRIFLIALLFHFGGGESDRRVFFGIKEVTAHEVAVALFVLRMDRLYVYTLPVWMHR